MSGMKTPGAYRSLAITSAEPGGRRLGVQFVINLLATAAVSTPALAAEPLASVVVLDSSVYEAAELYAEYQYHLGKPATASSAAAIAEGLQQKYVDDGYTRPAYAVLDAGSETGIARIRFVEARISEVRISGDSGPWHERLATLVSGLDSEQSLRPSLVRDALRRARRLPGLALTAATEPDSEQGAYVLSVESTYKPLEGGVTLSNRGTREIGRMLLTSRLVSNGLLGSGTSAGAFVSTAKDSDEYRGGGIFTTSPLGVDGASMQLQAAITSLAIDINEAPMRQRRERLLMRYSQPMVESDTSQLAVHVGLDVENLEVEHNSLDSRTERLRSVRTGLLFDSRRRNNQQHASLDIEQGLRGFGARIGQFDSADDIPDTDFTILDFRYAFVRRLGERWSLRWDAVGQYSADVLPSIKRFKVGGGRIGRGFEAAAASGDRGIGNKLELRRPVGHAVNWLERTDLYTYFDLGTAWKNGAPGRESASSAGVGFAWGTNNLSGYVELAQPLTHADADGQTDATIFAELGWRF